MMEDEKERHMVNLGFERVWIFVFKVTVRFKGGYIVI